MSQLNVFIDGSWLFKACGPERVLANRTEWPSQAFPLSFAKLDAALLAHIGGVQPHCNALGDRYLSTSIFTLPDDFDSWPDQFDQFTVDNVETTRKAVAAREAFARAATSAGYLADAIYRPRLKGYMLEKLIAKRYQEKQVDASVVALLVRSAITKPHDCHVVITGDADVLPAVKVAYPQYSKNVFIATTHPDELKAENRQTSYSLNNFDFEIPPFYLQDAAVAIIDRPHAYTCANCGKVFGRERAIPSRSRPYCIPCSRTRT